ncbi:MAG: rod shape-determining protein MreC [Clostridiales Family XIII bacterium]|jgi:rod shape-determining protein MreC|nr:rod shape-determining protein MreC [Clostridiales Family XIII bacterium]
MKDNSLIKKITISAAVLVLLLILILSSYLLKDQDTVVGDVAGSIITTVQKPVAWAGDKMSMFFTGMLIDDGVEKKLDKLEKENERLKLELMQDRMNADQLEELKELSTSLNTMSDPSGYKLQAADIISYNDSDVLGTFTIDKGTEVGIQKNAVVVAGDGLVGKVIKTEKGFSLVSPMIDESNKIGFVYKDHDADIGLLYGDGSGALEGAFMDNKYKPEEGMALYTSGIGGVYPAGIPIGKIKEVKKAKETAETMFTVAPYVEFDGMKKVAVILK